MKKLLWMIFVFMLMGLFYILAYKQELNKEMVKKVISRIHIRYDPNELCEMCIKVEAQDNPVWCDDIKDFIVMCENCEAIYRQSLYEEYQRDHPERVKYVRDIHFKGKL